MKAALRVAMIVALVATARQALAGNPASNGTGDGEANVPFASTAQAEVGAEDVGGGSGEPGGMAGSAAQDEAARMRAEAEFERQVWTAP